MYAQRKVLIVEDNYLQYQRLNMFFMEKGFAVIGHEKNVQIDNFDDAIRLAAENTPDLAILDIKINGKKDGLQLAGYLRERYTCRIIILTSEGNEENQRRSLAVSADGFVLKKGKPLDMDQLWIDVYRNMNKTESQNILNHSKGDYLLVTEIIPDEKNTNKAGISTEGKVETLIKWEEVSYISSFNASMNNSVLLFPLAGRKAWRCHSTLEKMMEKLPFHFAQFNKSEIVNINYLNRKKPNHSSYFIDDKEFLLSKMYKDEALRKIKVVLGWS